MKLESMTDPQTPNVPVYVKFIIGGISGVIAQAVTHPMDVMKIRMQVDRDNRQTLWKTAIDTFKSRGVPGFYLGLTAGMLRQITYTSTRFGLYSTMMDICRESIGDLNYGLLIGLGMVAGIAGSFAGTPADVVMIRTVGDMQLPPERRRNYGNAFSALNRIMREEGVRRMWTGAMPTMGRAAIVNGAQLGTYSIAKILLIDQGGFKDDLLGQFVSSMIASIIVCVTSLPVDLAKTRIQNWPSVLKPPGLLSSMLYISKNEGFFSLWRGFIPYYSRAGPNTIISMICMDQLRLLYIAYFLNNSKEKE